MPDEIITADQIEDQPVQWLWQNRIPLAAITIVDGKPGSNKSSLIYDLAARVSSGRCMPQDESDPAPAGAALLFPGEDTKARTRKQLEVAGAALDQVYVYDDKGVADPLTITNRFDWIRGRALAVGARLIVFDPLTRFLGGSINSEQAVRKATTALKHLADETGAAVVLVRHLRKSGASDPLYAGTGSIAVAAASRSMLLVGQHPSDEGLRVVAQGRSSYGPAAESLVFLPQEEDGGLKLRWQGKSVLGAHDLLDGGDKQPSAIREAVQFLADVLKGGPQPATEVKRLAREAGIAERTLRRAKDILAIKPKRQGFGADGTYVWEIPADSEIVHVLEQRANRDWVNATFVRKKRRRIEYLD